MENVGIVAGKKAYQMIMDGGFSLNSVSTYFAPASGPRFFVATGFDLALIKNNCLGKNKIVWLVGASSGAWRLATWVQPQPDICYQKLINAYAEVKYTKEDTPETLRNSLRTVLDSYLDEEAISFALSHKTLRVAFLVARAKHIMTFDSPFIQKLSLATCFFANAYKQEWLNCFFERMVFYSGFLPPAFCLQHDYKGSFTSLNEANFKTSLLASGAIPLVVPGQRDIYGAPKGMYRDGGLLDYNIAQNYAKHDDDIVLFFNHQERIIPTWMDKSLVNRKPVSKHIENVLMVYPTADFLLQLPDGKIPDRNDFVTHIDNNSLRTKKWKVVAELSTIIGEDFLELVASGKIKNRVRLIE
ncbi:MAG: hypothetical protein WCJ49_00555 [Deltaproteobacteria bacterium]